MAGAQSMAARHITTLAALLLSRRTCLPNRYRFSSAAFNPNSEATVPSGDVDDARPARLSIESVIYELKKLEKNPGKALDLFRWVEGRSPEQLGETAYVLLLRILAKKDWVKDFWVVVGEMTEKGIEMDKNMYKALLSCLGRQKLAGDTMALKELFRRLGKAREPDSSFDAAVKVILESEWGGEVEKMLAEIAFSVTDKMCHRMLSQLKSQPLKAMAFFRWAADRSNDYKHNSTAYNAMAKILGKHGMVSEFWEFVKEMKSESFDIDYDTYVKVFRSFHQNKRMKDAVELYEMMMAGPYKPGALDCAELFRELSLGDDIDFELMSRALRAHEACGHSMTKVIYEGIHRAFTGAGKFTEGEKIVQSMRDAGFEADNIIYRQLVFGLCKFGKLEDACKVFDEMEKLGCPPNARTWTILIQGHFSLGMVDQAFACYRKMIEKNCEPDANLLHVMVQGLLGNNKLDEACIMISKPAKIQPLEATFRLLIESLLVERKFEEALNALRLMKKHKYPLHNAAFVEYISKFGTVQDAVEYFQVLRGKHYAGLSCYRSVFEAFLTEGKQSEAQDLLSKCPEHIQQHEEILKLFPEAFAKKFAAKEDEKTQKSLLELL